MRKGGSKAKGNAWENKLLREVRGIDGMAHKTVGSGNSKDDKGDIAFLDYLVEAKHHKRFTDKELEGYWTKINIEAEREHKIPLLVYKQNNREPKVMYWSEVRGADGAIDFFRVMMYWREYLYRLRKELGVDE